jgi:hypothetical protein
VRKSFWISELGEERDVRVWKLLIRDEMRERVNAGWRCFEGDTRECSTIGMLSQYLLSNGIHSNEPVRCGLMRCVANAGTEKPKGMTALGDRAAMGAAALRPYGIEAMCDVRRVAILRRVGAGGAYWWREILRAGAGRMDGVSLRAT